MPTTNDILNCLEKGGFDPECMQKPDYIISGYSSMSNPCSNSVIFIEKADAVSSVNWGQFPQAALIILPMDAGGIDTSCAVVKCRNPRLAFYHVVDTFFAKTQLIRTIAETAIVKTSDIGEDISIGDYTYIDREVSIGKRVSIHNNVSIFGKVRIGDDCVIHSGVTIGEEAIGAVFDQGLIPVQGKHYGGVSIGNRVELFDRTTIHRGTIDDTFVGDDCKIGASSIVGHNSILKGAAIISSNVTLCGGVVIEQGVYIGTGVIVKERVHIKKKAYVCMGTCVLKNVPEESVVISDNPNPYIQGKAKAFRILGGILMD